MIQVLKRARNTNRHVVRRANSKHLLTINVVDEHDGYDRLCPFLEEDQGPCGGALGPFPRSKVVVPARRRLWPDPGSSGPRRRLRFTCHCVAPLKYEA